MRPVRRGNPCGSFRLVSRGDGGVLVWVGTGHPPPVLFFLPLHAPVLEPDLDVALGEAEGQCQLHTTRPGDVAVEQELFLQLQQLGAGVGRPGAFVFFSLRHHVGSWRQTVSVLNLSKLRRVSSFV